MYLPNRTYSWVKHKFWGQRFPMLNLKLLISISIILSASQVVDRTDREWTNSQFTVKLISYCKNFSWKLVSLEKYTFETTQISPEKIGELGRPNQNRTKQECLFLATLCFGCEEMTSQPSTENHGFMADVFFPSSLPWICLRNCRIKMQNNNYI